MDNSSTLTEASRKLVQSAYQAAIAGNYSEFFDYFDENAVVHEPRYLPYGGRYEGLANIKAMLVQLGEFMDVATLKIDSLVADGSNVIALIRIKRKLGNAEIQIAEHFVIKNGKAVEMKIYMHETASLT